MSTVKQLKFKLRNYKKKNCPPLKQKKAKLINECKRLVLPYKNKTVKELQKTIRIYKNVHCQKIPRTKQKLIKDHRLNKKIDDNILKNIEEQLKKEKERSKIIEEEYKKLQPIKKKELYDEKKLIDKFNKLLQEINYFRGLDKLSKDEKQELKIIEQKFNKTKLKIAQIKNLKRGEDIFTYNEIKNLVTLLPDYLIPVGSYIRKKEYPGDLDIVTTKNLKDVLKWFNDNFVVDQIIASGDKHLDIRISYNKKTLGINVWKGTKDQLIYLEFAYSYPQTLNIALRKKAKSKGYSLTQYGLFDKSGFLIPIKTFKDVFDILDVEFRTPEEQEIRETKYKTIKDGHKALQLIRGSKYVTLNKEDINKILNFKNKIKNLDRLELNKQKKEILNTIDFYENKLKSDPAEKYNIEKSLYKLYEFLFILNDAIQKSPKIKLASGLLQDGSRYFGGKEDNIDHMIQDEINKLKYFKRDTVYGPVDQNVDDTIYSTFYGEIPEDVKQRLLGGIDFLYPIKKGYQLLENQYRKRFCKGKSRPLKYGEIHPLCANFEGPGTRIDLEEVRNYPPYGPSDACAKQHDIEYFNASKIQDAGAREKAIRKADEMIISCLKEVIDDEPYKSLGLAGIESKMKIEDLVPMLAKLISGKEYFGQK